MNASKLEDAPLSPAELWVALNELLEAERAGARVARETLVEMGADHPWQALVADIQRDEVHWCGMLMKVIRGLNGAPSDQTGAFHGKAMAIADWGERMAFLNRGQAWVVRRLEGLLPRVADAGARSELQAMLDAHVGNIERVEQSMRRS
ncbi:MAG: hypothetical protein RIT26_944 [Pseudomonadota bacterium]|jgi:nitronate monooxygenase